jgi:hypothetical protein
VKWGATNAIDRDLSTGAKTEDTHDARWMKIQLGKTYFVHKIWVYNRFLTDWYDSKDWCAKSEANFKVCVDQNKNLDVSMYKEDVKQKSCGTLQLTYGLEQSDQIYELICNTDGDIVKLSKDTGRITIFEAVVIGTGTNGVED